MTTAIKSGGFQPGRAKTGGRKKGAPAKITLIREAILAAGEDAGDKLKSLGLTNGEGGLQGYLGYAALKETSAFLGLLGKVLPLQVANADDKPFQITTIELVAGRCIEDSETGSDS